MSIELTKLGADLPEELVSEFALTCDKHGVMMRVGMAAALRHWLNLDNGPRQMSLDRAHKQLDPKRNRLEAVMPRGME